MPDERSAAHTPWPRRLWRWLNPDLAGTLRRLDDGEVTRLYESILRNPGGIKGVHFRMVRGEIARRGL